MPIKANHQEDIRDVADLLRRRGWDIDTAQLRDRNGVPNLEVYAFQEDASTVQSD